MEFRQYEAAEFSIDFEENCSAEFPKGAIDMLCCTDVVVMIGFGRNLRLYTKDEFAEMKAIYDGLPPRDSVHLRTFFATAEACDLSEGRITISEELLKYANINGKAKLTFGSRNGSMIDNMEGCCLRTAEE